MCVEVLKKILKRQTGRGKFGHAHARIEFDTIGWTGIKLDTIGWTAVLLSKFTVYVDETTEVLTLKLQKHIKYAY